MKKLAYCMLLLALGTVTFAGCKSDTKPAPATGTEATATEEGGADEGAGEETTEETTEETGAGEGE